ncbi:histone-lysine N-methyltransferase SETMAR [Trichonephila clavipes]|nr:histone-lysine N-methyltransferase SETMAR [Trichonephila clavipes]
MSNILEATILSRKLQGEVVFIPLIPMILLDSPTHSNVCNFQFAWPLELLPYGQTLNSDLYCQQDRLKLAIDQKWPELANRRGVVFHQDNVRPHPSVVTRQKLWELGWAVLMHPPYSPDLTPSDFPLFLALQNFLSDKKLRSRKDCKIRLLKFLANKDQDFYERSITKLPLKLL